MCFKADLKRSKTNIEDIIQKNSQKLFFLIFLVAPFLFLYEFKGLISSYVGGSFLMFADWMKLLCYSFISYKALNVSLKQEIELKRSDFVNSIKNFAFFTGNIIILFIAIRSIPMILGLFWISINFLIPLQSAKFLSNVIFYAMGVYFTVKLSFILPKNVMGEQLNLIDSYKQTHNQVTPMLFSGMFAALPFLVILALYNNIMPFVETHLLTSKNEIVNVITKNILNLPVELFLEPYILIIGSVTLGYFYSNLIKTKS